MSLLYRGLHRAGVYQLTRQTIFFMTKLLVAGGLMVAAILSQLESMTVWLSWTLLERGTTLAALIGLGAGVYLITLLILGVRLKDLKAATE